MHPGLKSSEVKSKLEQFGYNELPSAKPKSVWKISAEVLKEPMFLLLVSCGTLYMILGDVQEGIVLLCTIFIIILITFFQYRKTERALEALKKLSSPRVLVVRDGIEQRIAGREVVPGDLIILNEGDRVPADAKIIETIHFKVDESLLTGESFPVDKSEFDGNNLIVSGSLVVQGNALAAVLHTGKNAQLGKIAVSLKEDKEEETRLQKEMKVLIRRLAIAGVFLSITIVLLFYITRGNFIHSLLSGLSAAMAILPEEFPVVLTVFLALGAWRLSKKNVLTRKSSAIETLGSATILCSDKTGTITQNKMDVATVYDGKNVFSRNEFESAKESVLNLAAVAAYACSANSVDPMEHALTDFAMKLNPAEKNVTLIREYPLTRSLLAMTRVISIDQMQIAATKGSPETIFNLCKLNEDEIKRHRNILNEFAVKGIRVLGVAQGKSNAGLPEKQEDFQFEFIGLIGLEDPVRPEVPLAIRECNEAGIKVMMITGDYPETAKSIAGQAGIVEQFVLTGDELTKLSDDELKEKIKNITVCARVIPEQKLRIVNALKANGEIVAMTGDGVNDAPALKAADIGIAMGNKGTDVAREASSLVLLDDNFASIVAAIRAGRRIFDNLQKAMSFIIAVHIPIIGLTMLPAFSAGLPVLLLPLHIVFLELIIDPVCSVAFEFEQEEKGIMQRKPRRPEDKFFGMKRITGSILQGLYLLALVMLIYFISIWEGHTEGEVRAIAFSTLVIGNIFLILTDLSKTRSFISIITGKNPAALFILTGAIVALTTAIYVPAMQKLFGFENPGFAHFVWSLTGLVLMLVFFEIRKLIRLKKHYADN